MVSETRKREMRKPKLIPTNKLSLRLVRVLEAYRERWNPKELADFAQRFEIMPMPWNNRSVAARRRPGANESSVGSHELE